MKVLFFVVFPEINAGARYRVYKYLPYLEKGNIAYTVCPPMSNQLFKFLYQTRSPIRKTAYYGLAFLISLINLFRVFTHDTIFIHQGLSYFGPPVFEKLMAKFGKKIIFDTDDAHFSKPLQATGIGARFHDRERAAKLCKIADRVIVSVEFLRQYAAKFNRHVTVIPTSIDANSYSQKSYEIKKDSIVTIGWVGSSFGLFYLKKLQPVFQRLSRTHDFRLKIICSEFIPMPGVDIVECRWSLEHEIADLQSIDIGTMPLIDSDFEKGKGGFKLIQYMGVGVPVVCSPVGINSEIVQDGVNGFLAASDDEWLQKLALLIDNPSLRETVGKRGRKSIRDRFSIEGNAAEFIGVLKSVHLNA